VKKVDNWILLAIASGLMFGVYNIIMKTYSAKATTNVSVMIIGLGVFLCGLVYLFFQKDSAAQLNSAIPVVGIILISAAIWFVGTMLQVNAWADAKGSLAIGAIILTVALCLTTTVAGLLFFGEKLTSAQILGIALALAGTILLSS